MRLSTLYEDRGLPTDVENFAIDVYNYIITHPGVDFGFKDDVTIDDVFSHDGIHITKDHISNTVKKYTDSNDHRIWVAVMYSDDIYDYHLQKAWCADGDKDSLVAMKIDKDLIVKHAAPKYGRKKGEFHPRARADIYRTLIHELTHAVDPNKERTRDRFKRDREKIKTSYRERTKGSEGDEYYRSLPWELDAQFNDAAAHWTMRAKDFNNTTEQMLDLIKRGNVHFDDRMTRGILKKHGLWKKFLKYLYKYVVRDAKRPFWGSKDGPPLPDRKEYTPPHPMTQPK